MQISALQFRIVKFESGLVMDSSWRSKLLCVIRVAEVDHERAYELFLCYLVDTNVMSWLYALCF